MTKLFLVETKMASKAMERYFITLEIRKMECDHNDPIFLAKKKTKQKNRKPQWYYYTK